MKLILLPFLISVALCISACSDETLSAEDEIKSFIEKGKLAAEQRSSNDLADLIENAYTDQRGWNKTKVKKIARAYFFTHKNINLLTKIESIDFQNNNSAFVVLYVAMAGSVITDLNSLSGLRARIYKFELQLIRNDVWLLQQARWEQAKLKDML